MKYLIALLSFISITAQAEEWDAWDKTLGLSALTATVADWGQTRYIAKHPNEFYEKNPILGDHPSTGRVDAYFVGVIVGGALLANWLPSTERKWFLGIVSVVEFSAVNHNKQIGVKIAF